MKRIALFFMLAFACPFFFAAANADEKKGEEKLFTATVGSDGVQRVDVLGGGYFFDPNHIIVKVNVPVELKVRKESGIVPHNIVMKAPEAGIEFDESMGSEPKVIRFTPTRAGKYPFYCSKKLLFFEGHREKGMEGVLDVVE
jgi:plastocyanin domain-containing protein